MKDDKKRSLTGVAAANKKTHCKLQQRKECKRNLHKAQSSHIMAPISTEAAVKVRLPVLIAMSCSNRVLTVLNSCVWLSSWPLRERVQEAGGNRCVSRLWKVFFFVNLLAAFFGQCEQRAGFKPFLYAYSSLQRLQQFNSLVSYAVVMEIYSKVKPRSGEV